MDTDANPLRGYPKKDLCLTKHEITEQTVRLTRQWLVFAPSTPKCSGDKTNKLPCLEHRLMEGCNGKIYLTYTTAPQTITLDLKGEQPYKVDRVDTWNMKVAPVGTAHPGEHTFAAPHGGFAYRFTPYAPGEKLRPEAKASADVLQGSAPLTVTFSAAGDLAHHWTFGDGTTSTESNPTHVYENFGQYVATLTVMDAEGDTATTSLAIHVSPEAPADIRDTHRIPRFTRWARFSLAWCS